MPKRIRKTGRTQAGGRAEVACTPRSSTGLVPRKRRAAASAPSPFALMRRFAEDMDRLFDDFRLGAPSVLSRFELPWEGREAAAAALQLRTLYLPCSL